MARSNSGRVERLLTVVEVAELLGTSERFPRRLTCIGPVMQVVWARPVQPVFPWVWGVPGLLPVPW